MENASSDVNLLLTASSSGKISEVAQALEAGADVNMVNEYGDTPLHFAVMCESINVIDFLLSKGADPHIKGRWGKLPIHNAVLGPHCNTDVLDLLWQAGAALDVSANWGHSPLHYAAADGQTKIVEWLLERGAYHTPQATWYKIHKYYGGHYDTIMLQIYLDEEPKHTRRYFVTPRLLAKELKYPDIEAMLEMQN